MVLVKPSSPSLAALPCSRSDFDWENLSIHIRRAIVAGRVDDVKTEYSEAPLPLDPALAEVIFEWRRRTEFSADSDFVFASPFMAGEKPYTPWNMQHNHLRSAAVKAGLGPKAIDFPTIVVAPPAILSPISNMFLNL